MAPVRSGLPLLWGLLTVVWANAPPRFILEGQASEIVVNRKEGPATPLGTVIAHLRGSDDDSDPLAFGILGADAKQLLEVVPTGPFEADLKLKKLLDREVQGEYQIILTLTDGRLGEGEFIRQSLLLLVEDVNDNEPTFLPYESTIMVEENSAPRVIARLKALDRDEGLYGQVLYRLQYDDPEDALAFSVSTVADQAVVRLMTSLDFEAKSLYQLNVLAFDRGAPGEKVNVGSAALVVRVQDVEDMPPEFIKSPPVTRIPEDIAVNSGVLVVRAVDGDKGVGNDISYTISQGDPGGFFALDSDSGVLYVAKPLDRERFGSNGEAFFIKILAEEKSSVVQPSPSAETEVTVVLEDVNDQTPTFRAAHYVAEVTEGAQFNMPVNLIGDAIPEVYDDDQAHIVIEDGDKGLNGTFRLELSGDRGLFDVTPREGINMASFLIRVRNSALLDYEKVQVVNFTVIARETVSLNPKSSSALVTVRILDTNDNIPEFEEESYEVFIPENSVEGSLILQVTATDKDSGMFGSMGVRYTAIRGAMADKLQLDPESGRIALRFSGALDRESVPEFFLTVEARDSLGKGNRNTVGVHVVVEDVNDNPPVFLQKRYEVRIFEGTRAFQEPLRVLARDADLNGTVNSEVRYSIAGGDPLGNFTIDPAGGEIRPKAPLDFEAVEGPDESRYFNLTVKAEDLGMPPLSTTTQVLVYIVDENDHQPVFERFLYQSRLSEDARGGHSVIQVRAHDMDGSLAYSQVAYRIQRGAKDKFVIDPDSGVIMVAQGAVLDPDLTEPRTTSYALEVVALDGGIGEAQQRARTLVNITVMDVNNKPPIIIDPGIISVYENAQVGSYLTQVVARDPDEGNQLKFTLVHNLSEARNEDGGIVKAPEIGYTFEVNHKDGGIRLIRSLDRESVETFYLAVTCEDVKGQKGEQTSTATLTINVKDVNDNSPAFRYPYYLRSVAENAEVGTTVGAVVAVDADKNRSITYQLEGPRDIINLLSLDNETGEMVVRDQIDREQHAWLNFSIRATDSGFPSRFSLVEVFVQVIDENDNNPQFLRRNANSTVVREDAPPGTVIARFTAVDPDAGDFGRVTYLLERRSSLGKFKIDPDSGELSVATPLNREEQSSFTLIIEAWDNYRFGSRVGGESRNAFLQFDVFVADINDEAPEFELHDSCAIVTEFHEVGDVITYVRANDNDDPETPNGRVVFSIVGGNDLGLFALERIDIHTARVFASRSLLRRYGNYSLTVAAQDSGVPPNTATGIVEICVADFNDNAPRFVSPDANVTIRVPEVRAVDDDEGANAAVRYRLKHDSLGDFKTFNINGDSGAITLARPLDRERQKVYEIRVEAYDQGIPTPLSSDLDLTIFVRNVNDYEPQFLQDVFIVNFTEHKAPRLQKTRLLDAVDRDEVDDEENSSHVCFFIVGGDLTDAFVLNPVSHELTTARQLDREEQASHTLVVRASENCMGPPPSPVEAFDSRDDSLLKVIVNVQDINDNSPEFVRRLFTGGITTSMDFGYKVMELKAVDPDDGENARLSYFLEGRVQETLTEGLEHLRRSPFVVNRDTGSVTLNFDPQRGMKGYFDFEVFVNDTGGLSDRARVFIYLLREDQRVRFTLRQTPEEVRQKVEYLRDYLGNVTGAIVNVDDFRIHENHDGTVDKTKTDLYLHLVDREDNSVLEVAQVLEAIDRNVHRLDYLFKELNVLETQQGQQLIRADVAEDNLLFVWLVGVIGFLALLLVLTLALCLAQRARYSRQLRAATATAYAGSHDAVLNRSGVVPNTNLHSIEGSNPVWMNGYENEWYEKDTEDALRYHQFLHPTDCNDSLDENAVDSSLSPRGGVDRDLSYVTHSGVPKALSRDSGATDSTDFSGGPPSLSDTYRSNLYQTFSQLANHLEPGDKKLETTEL